NRTLFVLLILTAALLRSVWVFGEAFASFADSPEEYAALFQAEIFSRGKFWEPWHDLPGFFVHSGIVQEDGIRVGRIQPGYPLLLRGATRVGVTAAVINPLLSTVCGLFLYRLTTRRCAPEVAVWGLLVIVLSGCFILNAASYRPAVLSLLFLLLAVHCIDRYEGTAYPS